MKSVYLHILKYKTKQNKTKQIECFCVLLLLILQKHLLWQLQVYFKKK